MFDDAHLPVYADNPSFKVQVVSCTAQVGNFCVDVHKLYASDDVPNNLRCHVPNTTVTPLRVARFIRIRIPMCLRGATNILIVRAMQRWLVPRSVVKSMKGYLFVWVVNPDNQPAQLTCGTCIATLHDVSENSAQDPDSTCTIFSNMPQSNENNDGLPSLSHQPMSEKGIDSCYRNFQNCFQVILWIVEKYLG